MTGLLADRYELVALIAGGGMGQVWRGRDTMLGRPVAIKVLRDQFAADPAFRTRFRAEAQHAALLNHPHIAAVHDYGEVPAGPGTPPLAYLVMELVEGESLAELLHREGRLDATRTLGILRQAAAGLAAAHAAGVVHRDIKPANLLVARDGTVKLTDFGIARSASSAAVTGTGQVIGTAHYLSPEQAAGGTATPASDVYALGAVGYECLAGRRAFDGENPVQIAVKHIREHPEPLPPDIAPAACELVERAMAKDPEARFQDGAALRDAVDGVLAGARTTPSGLPRTAVLPVVAPPTVPVVAAGTAQQRRRRFPVPALLGALAVLAAVLVAGVVALLGDGTASPGAGNPPATGTPTTSAPVTVEIVAEELQGRPVDDVQAELIGRGLRVELVPVQNGDVPAGEVLAVDPTGTLLPGDLVRVSYSVPPVPAPAPVDEGEGEEEGGGNGNENEKKDDEEGGGNGDEGGGNGNEGGGNGTEGRDG